MRDHTPWPPHTSTLMPKLSFLTIACTAFAVALFIGVVITSPSTAVPMACLVGISLYILIRNDKHRQKQDEAAKDAAAPARDKKGLHRTADIIAHSLEPLNIATTRNEDDDSVNLHYEYQSGHFTVVVHQETEREITLLYPGFASYTLANIDNVRYVCNELNAQSFKTRVFYTINGEENEITLHLTYIFAAGYTAARLTQLLMAAMSEIFSLARVVADRIDEQNKSSEEQMISDIEHANGCNTRLRHLASEMEVLHTEEALSANGGAPFDPLSPMTLGELLSHCSALPEGSHLDRLRIVRDEHVETIEGEAASLVFPIHRVLIDGEGTEAHFATGEATLKIYYTVMDDDLSHMADHVQVFQFDPTDETDERLYYQITLLTTSTFRNDDRSETLEALRLHAEANVLIFAHDKRTEQQLSAEFRYMWQDAKDKEAEGKLEEEGTEEQKAIVGLTRHNIAQVIYWGNRYMLEKRFAEAVRQFTMAWNFIRWHFEVLTERNKGLFYRVAYALGFCYFEMKQYKMAYYYLDGIERSGDPEYITELINCMVALRDYRVEDYLEDTRKRLENQIDYLTREGEEVGDTLRSFHSFLRRREVYILVDKGRLEEAEQKCREMLNEPENRAFAENELAYIEQQKKNREKE